MPYANDAEHAAAVLAAYDYDPTPDDDLRAEAGADGIEVSMREAEHYNDMALPSGRVRFGLHGANAVREAVDQVMTSYYGAPCHPDPVEWRPEMPGVQLPTFDRHNPAHMRGMFVLFGDRPEVLHPMRFDSLEDLVARQLKKRTGCYWAGHNVFCLSSVREYLCFSRGQYVVALGTCPDCSWWLTNGAPDAITYTRMRARRVARPQS